MKAWKNVLLLVEVKPTKKIRAGPQIRFFVIFFKFGSLVFLEIAEGDNLEHHRTTSRGKTHAKLFGAPN